MINYFSVENFRSIKEKMTLDLTKSRRVKNLINNYSNLNGTNISLCTVIYGANASGKSNLLRALKVLNHLVLNSARFNVGDEIEYYEPFKLTKANNKPVIFEIDFYSEKIRYFYILHFNREKIEKEVLFFYPGNSKKKILLFERKGNKIKFGDSFKGEKKTLEKITLPNQLFLSKAVENNAEVCIPVYSFFKNKVKIYQVTLKNIPLIKEFTEKDLEDFIISKLVENPEASFAKNLNNLICALDTGIKYIKVKKTDLNRSINLLSDIPEKIKELTEMLFNKYEIKTIHHILDNEKNRISDIEFDIELESSGTKNLLLIGGLILDALENGSVLIIDEFEKNLHPLLTSYLIKLFQHPEINKKSAQLIFATHDVTLLSDENFNRDQIWFTQKNEFGATELIRCSNIKGFRLNTPIDKWYLSGRLGGTPIINDIELINSLINVR